MSKQITTLFLDDFKYPEWYDLKAEDIQVCRTGEKALKWAKKRPIDRIYLDHDLGEGMSGYTMLERLIEEFHNPPKEVIIISLNAVGSQRITALCRHHGISVMNRLPPERIMIGGQSG